eukprot:5316561-Amphidinium_carterae.2
MGPRGTFHRRFVEAYRQQQRNNSRARDDTGLLLTPQGDGRYAVIPQRQRSRSPREDVVEIAAQESQGFNWALGAL